MTSFLRGGLAVFLFGALGCPLHVWSASELTVEPNLTESKYCIDDAGTVSLRAKVRFTYHNTGQQRILLPRFGQVAAYSLFRDEESLSQNRAEAQEQYRVRRFFDETKLDRARPDQGLFDSLPPGESQTRIHEISIILRPPRRLGVSLLGADHYLRIEISHWFGSRQTAEDLRQAWRDFGILWIDGVVASPLKLHIESDPDPRRCRDRVD